MGAAGIAAAGRPEAWAPGEVDEATDQAHLVEGLDRVARRLGGVTRRWRFDRTSTVCHPASGRLRATFAPVAMHLAVGIDLCPPGHGWRKGSVEKGIHSITQRWWRTVPDDATPASAQASLDRFCARQDSRARRREGATTTVGALADAEPLREVPAPYPATIEVTRTVSDQALVAFRKNFYSVGPGHAGEAVHVRHRLGATEVDIVTGAGTALARHVRQPDSAGAVCRLDEHVAALERVVLASFSDRAPCRRKHRRHPLPGRWPRPNASGPATPGAPASRWWSTSPPKPTKPAP